MKLRKQLKIAMVLVIPILFVWMAFCVNFAFANYSSNNSIVVSSGESIQEAINNANVGDTIIVTQGTYKQWCIVVNKTLTIVGESLENTIIDGNGTADVIFQVTANDAVIENFTLRNTATSQYIQGTAIRVYNTTNVQVRGVVTRNNFCGVELRSSNFTKMINCGIFNSTSYGVHIRDKSCNNTFVSNTIANNSIGIYIADQTSSHNIFYHNNFINNTNQASIMGISYFDNGYPSGGNYWNTHTAPDENHGQDQKEVGSDGILDESYNSLDKYPLAYPFIEWKITVGEEDFHIGISTNSTINSISLNKEEKTLILNLTVNENANGFCRISIPKKLLFCDSLEDWNITNGDKTLESLVLDDENYTYMYFSCEHTSAEEIVFIKGTYAVSEVSLVIAIIFMSISSFIFVFRKMKRFKRSFTSGGSNDIARIYINYYVIR